MSMILISGGSGSGKSEYAERRAAGLHAKNGGTLHYAATMMVYDEESRRRVERHRKMREGKGFVTTEIPLHIGALPVMAGDTVLVECLSNLLANEMYEPSGAGNACVETITDGILRLHGAGAALVVVTNEVFSDGVRYDASTMLYIERLGALNRRLAELADEVFEVVAGIALPKKGGDAACFCSSI